MAKKAYKVGFCFLKKLFMVAFNCLAVVTQRIIPKGLPVVQRIELRTPNARM